MTGRVVGHYRILERIGAGGMGVVYSADDLRLQRRVALKFLPAGVCADTPARERLFAEARAASALDHPNICTIYAIEESPDEGVFIVMPAYTGETLKARIERDGVLRVDEALKLAAQIAEGLSRAHAAGIVHRDIKPANVMVTADGVAKILDFGLAVDPEATVEYTATVAGTLAYMSPEQAVGESIDTGADIWGLGVILYEMLAGAAPFQGDSAAALLASITRAQPPPIGERRSGLPRPVGNIVARALAPSRGARYARIDDMLSDLRAAVHESDAATRSAARRVPSIAVLPFSDMSPAKDQDWFCEGIAEELINALAALQNVRVAARTSSFQFKGQALDVRAIGDRLDTQTVLEGSVRKAGNRLRITAQLIDVASGYHLWSERYDRDMDDVFAVQDEIARAIVGKLRVRLTGDSDGGPLVRQHTAKPEAYQKYLEGKYYWTRRHKGAFESAIGCFRDAIEMDPDYALAHAGLADAFSVLALYGIGSPLKFGPLAKAEAERALALDQDLAEAHSALGLVRWTYERDWDGAIAAYEHALELNPNANLTRGQLGSVLVYTGQGERGLACAVAAAEAEPFNPVLSFYQAGLSSFLGLDEAAIKECDRILSIIPDSPLSIWVKAGALGQLGRYDEAIALANGLNEMLPESRLGTSIVGAIEALAGHRDAALAVAARLEKERGTGYAPALAIADIYCGLGDADRALQWLETAFEAHEGFLPRVFTDRSYHWLRADARFLSLFRKLKIGDPWPNSR